MKVLYQKLKQVADKEERPYKVGVEVVTGSYLEGQVVAADSYHLHLLSDDYHWFLNWNHIAGLTIKWTA